MNTPMPNTGVNVTGPVPPMDPFSNGTGSGRPNTEKVGTVTDAQIQEIAETKAADMSGADIEAMKRSIAGTARSMGLVVEG